MRFINMLDIKFLPEHLHKTLWTFDYNTLEIRGRILASIDKCFVFDNELHFHCTFHSNEGLREWEKRVLIAYPKSFKKRSFWFLTQEDCEEHIARMKINRGGVS